MQQFPIADVVALEARRLQDAQDRPVHERRDMLADLAGRLAILLDGQDDPAYEPLHALVRVLTGDGDVESRWAEARRVLDGFAPGAAGTRTAFWKR